MMRTVQAGPLTGLIALVLTIAALAGAVAVSGAGLSAAGWVVGMTCGVITNASLAHGLSRHRRDRLSPADWVTLARATLVAGVAALVADSFVQPAAVTMLVSLSVAALVLDAVDGWVARRTRTAATLGAHFDAEVDAFLILVLSVYVARSAGAWVLAIGAARYVFLAAGWALPWLREPLPPRYWRKVVAATQGIVLTVAAADVLPPAVIQTALVVALALLAESFGRDVWWLWRRRPSAPATPAGPGRRRVRTSVAVVLTILAALLVSLALVAPDQPSRLTPSAFARLPLEGIVVIALALVLPATARRVLAWVVGPALGLLVIVKILDIGFFTTFDRPFDPHNDSSYAGIGIETLRASIGRTEANLVAVGAVVLAVALVVLTTLALLRLTRVAAGHRRWSLQAVTALGVVWALCWVFGAQLVSHTPIASTSAAGLVVDKVRVVWADIRDPAIFAKEISHDRFRDTPGDQLLTGLRGKDVIVAFVESYGKVAVQGSSFSPQVDAVLASGTRRLQAAGFASRSAFLTSPTFGGISWLAHSTTQSGVWVDSQRRYDQLVATDRFTLSQAFGRAGWRTVDDVPSNNRTWRPGSSFYHYDKVYDSRQRRVSRPALRLRQHARPVRPRGAAAPRARQARPPPRLRRGRPRVEPHTVDAHPPADRLARRGRRLDLQPPSRGRVDEGRALQRSPAGTCGIRPVDRILPERAGLVRAALRRRRSSCSSSWAIISPRRSSPGRVPAMTCRSRSSPTTRRCCTGSRGGAGMAGCSPARGRRSGR